MMFDSFPCLLTHIGSVFYRPIISLPPVSYLCKWLPFVFPTGTYWYLHRVYTCANSMKHFHPAMHIIPLLHLSFMMFDSFLCLLTYIALVFNRPILKLRFPNSSFQSSSALTDSQSQDHLPTLPSQQRPSTGVWTYPIDTNLHATSCQRDNAETNI